METINPRRISDLTLEEFDNWLGDWMKKNGFQVKQQDEGVKSKNWVYGVAGVRAKFGWGYNTALEKIHGVIAPACIWDGPRKLRVDVDFANNLLKLSNN